MSIVKVLMERDGMTRNQAVSRFMRLRKKAKALVSKGKYEEAYYIMEEIGLEPDYLMELIA